MVSPNENSKFCLKMKQYLLVFTGYLLVTTSPCRAEQFQAPQFFYKIYESRNAPVASAPTQGLTTGSQNRQQLERWAGGAGQQFFNWVRSNGSELGTTVTQVEDFFKFQPRFKNSIQNNKNRGNEKPLQQSTSGTQHKFNLRILNLTGQTVATYSGWFNSRLVLDPGSQSLQITSDHPIAKSIQFSVQNLWNRHESRNSILLRYGF